MKEKRIIELLKQASSLGDKKLARELRKSAIESLNKVADEYGLLQQYKGTPAAFEAQKHYTAQRGGKDGGEKEYGVGPEHKKSDSKVNEPPRSLSTRYSPDRVGVQARRVSDGVYQDPITNKVYDWNEGFTSEDGQQFPGGRVSLQTDIMHGE